MPQSPREPSRPPRVRQVRHGRLRRRRPALFLLTYAAAIVAVLVVSGGSLGAYATYSVLKDAKPTVHLRVIAAPGKTATPPPALTAATGAVNLLMVATDTRTGQGAAFSDKADLEASSGVGNNDTNILVHIADDHKSMSVVSFPRDLMLPIPACPDSSGGTYPATSKGMLNTSLSRGGDDADGLSCVASTITQLTGVQIDYAALVSFDGVVAMSNAIGGVTVCLATPLNDTDVTPALHLPAGNVDLVGDQAAAFLRSRHGVGDGSDLGRLSNQQTFMSAMMRQIVSGGVLTKPTRLFDLADAVVSNTTRSDTLSDPTTLVKIGLAIKSVGLSNITFVQYPAVDDPDNANRVVPNLVAGKALNAALQNNQALQLAPGSLGRAAELAPGSTTAATATPSAAASAAPSATSSAAASAATSPTSSGSATPSTDSGPSVAVLPGSVTGQSADQVTCTKKD